jgi:hypothetical protein
MSNVDNYFAQPAEGDSKSDNKLNVNGTMVVNGSEVAARKLGNILASNDVAEFSEGGDLNISGFNIIEGGTGIADLIMPAPQEGAYNEIILDSISSGSVVVTTEAGTTFDGTNNTATFDAAAESLRLAYKSDTEWQIIENNGSVALSSV